MFGTQRWARMFLLPWSCAFLAIAAVSGCGSEQDETLDVSLESDEHINNASRYSTLATGTNIPDLGTQVLVFDPSMGMDAIQKKCDAIFNKQVSNHFGNERYLLLFKPGQYKLDVQLGFFTQVMGLGRSPDDVIITGAIRSKARFLKDNNATQNFWRGIENISVIPTKDNNRDVWAVSQGTHLRRFHVKGSLVLSDGGWSSGGFVADSKIDGTMDSGSQQQWINRNSEVGKWNGSSWNMVFVGQPGAPNGDWPNKAYTTVAKTPIVREKPFLALGSSGSLEVVVPNVKKNSQGTSWRDTKNERSLSLDKFFIARAGKDTSKSLNQALASGKHLLLTPGVYKLDAPIVVKNPDTIVLGLGFATLLSKNGAAVLETDDDPGIILAGLLLDAGEQESSHLLQMASSPTSSTHSDNPSLVSDVHCRVGGQAVGKVDSCFVINASDVVLDNTWLWRADHGNGVGWTVNTATHGLMVRGQNVTAYGLFVEHFQMSQTVWAGNDGHVFFYQSEIPYDVPNQNSWMRGNTKGYASYKVGSRVKTHEAQGLGVYAFFLHPVRTNSAFEAPLDQPGIKMSHMTTLWLGSSSSSGIDHIINNIGGRADSSQRTSRSTH